VVHVGREAAELPSPSPWDRRLRAAVRISRSWLRPPHRLRAAGRPERRDPVPNCTLVVGGTTKPGLGSLCDPNPPSRVQEHRECAVRYAAAPVGREAGLGGQPPYSLVHTVFSSR
jgi:hypothetical protein